MASRLNVPALSAPYALVENNTPRSVTTDAYGYRRSRSAMPYDVVLCGDSFFINDVIADSIAAALGQKVGNAAIDGRGTLTMARFLDEPAPGFRQPKAVVWLRSETGITATGFLTQFNQYRSELRPVTNPIRRVYASWRETIFWPNNLNDYLNETSTLRKPLQRVASDINWRYLQQRDTTVILGKTGLPAGIAPMQFLNDEKGLLPLPTAQTEIDAIADQIAQVKKLLAERGIKLFFAVAPDKSTIYRERLPDGRHYRAGFIEQFYSALQQRDISVINLASGLRKTALEQPTSPLFYTTDTHWNPRGQTIAAHIIADSLRHQQVSVQSKLNKSL
jgi:hypothetical protein